MTSISPTAVNAVLPTVSTTHLHSVTMGEHRHSKPASHLLAMPVGWLASYARMCEPRCIFDFRVLVSSIRFRSMCCAMVWPDALLIYEVHNTLAIFIPMPGYRTRWCGSSCHKALSCSPFFPWMGIPTDDQGGGQMGRAPSDALSRMAARLTKHPRSPERMTTWVFQALQNRSVAFSPADVHSFGGCETMDWVPFIVARASRGMVRSEVWQVEGCYWRGCGWLF